MCLSGEFRLLEGNAFICLQKPKIVCICAFSQVLAYHITATEQDIQALQVILFPHLVGFE